MAGEAYLLEKPPGPGPARRFIDQVVMPMAIDVAGSGEVAIERLSRRTGLRPAYLVAGLAGIAVSLVTLAARRKLPRAAHPTRVGSSRDG